MKFTGERVVPSEMANDPLTYQQHLMRYAWALRFCVGSAVLDAACGAGYGLDLISGVARAVIGFDNNLDALDYAKKMYKFSNRPSMFLQVDLEKVDFCNFFGQNPVDCVVSFETIEHLDNPDFFLENVKNILLPGQRFIFSIPNAGAVSFHKKIYDLAGAKKLISRHFKNVEWYGQEPDYIGDISEGSDFFLGVATKE